MGLFIVFIIIIIYVALSQSVKQSNNQNRRGNNPAMGRPPQQIYRPQMNQPKRAYQQAAAQPHPMYQQTPDPQMNRQQAQQQLKNRLAEKYQSQMQQKYQQQNGAPENKILQQMELHAAEERTEEAKATAAEKSAATEKISAMEVIEPMEFTYDIPQSDNMKKVQELMVTGFSGNLNFERDFVAEGIEMLNRFELQ